MSSSVLALYYFQGETGENLDMPNAFMFSTSNKLNITFGDFVKQFPGNPTKCSLHFRFKSEDPIITKSTTTTTTSKSTNNKDS